MKNELHLEGNKTLKKTEMANRKEKFVNMHEKEKKSLKQLHTPEKTPLQANQRCISSLTHILK